MQHELADNFSIIAMHIIHVRERIFLRIFLALFTMVLRFHIFLKDIVGCYLHH